jgi:Leucine-rich repeat (LRR) protein
VTDIVLSSNNVVGQIPGDVSRFANLTNLALDGNDLYNSTIPSEIGMLTNLQNLVLSSSNIGGIIPTELYKLGHALQIFQVDNNKMTGTRRHWWAN